jgi:hypothetical protein
MMKINFVNYDDLRVLFDEYSEVTGEHKGCFDGQTWNHEMLLALSVYEQYAGQIDFGIYRSTTTDDIATILNHQGKIWDCIFDIQSVDGEVFLPFSKEQPLLIARRSVVTDIFEELKAPRRYRLKTCVLNTDLRKKILDIWEDQEFETFTVRYRDGTIHRTKKTKRALRQSEFKKKLLQLLE